VVDLAAPRGLRLSYYRTFDTRTEVVHKLEPMAACRDLFKLRPP